MIWGCSWLKTIMILGASILQLPAIEKARDMGFNVVVADMNPEAIGFSVPDIKKEIISTIDTIKILQAARKHQIDGIMTLASDMPMQSVAVVCHEMGLVGISKETALKATNKAFMRDALKENGVPVPLYYRVKGLSAFIDAVKNIRDKGYKCIVKPADNSGSRGVDLLKEDCDLEEAYNYTNQFSRSGEIVVEEYMEGPEVSVETLAINGTVHVIQITDKLTTGAPYFVEMGHSQPSQLCDEIKDQIGAVAISANKAIGIKNGPSHTEIKVTKDGPKIVELGARLGGDCITTHLVPLSTGVNMVECSILIALGEIPDLRPKWNRGSAIRYLESEQGIIQAIGGVDEACEVSGIKQVSIVHNVGDEAKEIRNSVDRVGFVIAQADSAKDAVLACEEAKRLIKVDVNHDI